MSVDVIVIGAGIIGLSAARQIRRRSRLRVLVLEKAAGVGEGSTGASSAVLRHRYSRDEMVTLSRDGLHAYRCWDEFTGLATPRATFRADGVLWLPGADTRWAAREAVRLQALGVPAEVLEDSGLGERFPALNHCVRIPDTATGEAHECAGGGQHLYEPSGGHIDPVACAEDLVEALRGDGVEVRFGAGVSEIRQRAGCVTGVGLADGSIVDAPNVINASGPWAAGLLEPLELALPWSLVPTRIQMLFLDRPQAVVGPLPVCVDMNAGIYFRPQSGGQQILLGSVREEDEREAVDDPEAFNRFADEAFSVRALHALHHRIPALPYRGRIHSYCGLYTVNRQDVHPIVGESAIRGLYLANAFSGHGFKIAPAVGALLAQAITGEQSAAFDTAVPAGFLAPGREPLAVDDKSVLA